MDKQCHTTKVVIKYPKYFSNDVSIVITKTNTKFGHFKLLFIDNIYLLSNTFCSVCILYCNMYNNTPTVNKVYMHCIEPL